jgi:hypothetical protein
MLPPSLHPEDGGSMVLRNVDILPNITRHQNPEDLDLELCERCFEYRYTYFLINLNCIKFIRLYNHFVRNMASFYCEGFHSRSPAVVPSQDSTENLCISQAVFEPMIQGACHTICKKAFNFFSEEK